MSYPWDKKLLALFDVNEFWISAPQCGIHSRARTCDVLDILVHKIVPLSHVIATDAPDWENHFPHTGRCQRQGIFVSCRKIHPLQTVLKLCLCLGFNSSANWLEEEAHKATREFTSFITSVAKLATKKKWHCQVNILIYLIEIADQNRNRGYENCGKNPCHQHIKQQLTG